MSSPAPAIEQLKELELPAPVSYLPQTWGWWLLLGLLAVMLSAWAGHRYWQWRRDRYRREALLRLAQLQGSGDSLAALRELPELLKRVALSMPEPYSWTGTGLAGDRRWQRLAAKPWWPARAPAERRQAPPGPLHGQAWQDFLQRHSRQPLPADFSLRLAQLAYAPDEQLLQLPAQQRRQLFDSCRAWVERHHVAA
ncbi:DUF4381 domain-containing protein [Pseudomonas sp. NFIX28]|uniref:DUF4381 domain-containing protein n=1 Tax=Pseudomonas sp. NFIX28 TaxID=1566235 RepID=UPI000897CCDF|nr:DUF4381 domain-containing protein [Pseudomonas sp. NFIX28]SDZ48684.1 protein of unknown function [Pseudomonas sp. NFIX28]